MQRKSSAAETALVFLGALLLFGTTATGFEARVTDISALRVLAGDVPYRDFWTMYAPGSFTVLAVAFAAFGRELMVSNLLGIATSAATVAACYRLARTSSDALMSMSVAAVIAVAYFDAGYATGFTSYPPALFLIVLAALRATARCHEPGARWAVIPGLLLGGAALFKHDVAGYAALAVGAGLVAACSRARRGLALAPAALVGVVSAAVVASTAGLLLALGAGHDAWLDLVVFPLGDFRQVRGQYFPIVPAFHASFAEMARELAEWGIFNLPLVALVIGVVAILRERQTLEPARIFVAVFGFVAFWIHWEAAHIQLNTNAISLAAWGALVAGAGLRTFGAGVSARSALLSAAVVLWMGCYIGESSYRLATRDPVPTEWLGLPHLRGIRAPLDRAQWMRGLATQMQTAADHDAPLFFMSYRNDVQIFAEPVPFWLTDRRPATRHHELHPAITDTEGIQRQMLAQVALGPPPLVVREHRFTDDEGLDDLRELMRQQIPVGSRLVDEWVAGRYDRGPLLGTYEVMRERAR